MRLDWTKQELRDFRNLMAEKFPDDIQRIRLMEEAGVSPCCAISLWHANRNLTAEEKRTYWHDNINQVSLRIGTIKPLVEAAHREYPNEFSKFLNL